MEHVVLGAHDGVESWMVRVGAERSPLEQQMVSLHEHQHHSLHSSTPWGLVMTFLAATRRPEPLQDPVWRWLAEGCRTVHEVWATYFSVASDERFLGLLEGNAAYMAHYRTAAALGASWSIPAPHRALMINGLLHSMMAPSQLSAFRARRLAALRLMDVEDDWAPDTRLAGLVRLLSSPARDQLTGALSEVRDEPGLMGFRSALARRLTQLGLPTMTIDAHREWAMGLVQHLNSSSSQRFDLAENPADPVGSALDDFQRERLRLHDRPLPLEFVSPDDQGWQLSWLARGHESIGAHSWLVWMRGDLLRRQFMIEGDRFTSPRPVLGFLGVDRVNGAPVARMWPFSELSPAIVARGLRGRGSRQVLFFTTLATIMDSDDGDDFRGIDPVFVLIDQSLLGFLDRTRDRGAKLSWRTLRLSGDRELAIVLMEQAQLAGVYFMMVASRAGHRAFLAWLLAQPPEVAAHDPALADPHRGHLDALIQHLVGSFWELNLFGGTAHDGPVHWEGDSAHRYPGRGPAG
jgi:hypothetical protein